MGRVEQACGLARMQNLSLEEVKDSGWLTGDLGLMGRTETLKVLKGQRHNQNVASGRRGW